MILYDVKKLIQKYVLINLLLARLAKSKPWQLKVCHYIPGFHNPASKSRIITFNSYIAKLPFLISHSCSFLRATKSTTP
jgi:hypothetical protein